MPRFVKRYAQLYNTDNRRAWRVDEGNDVIRQMRNFAPEEFFFGGGGGGKLVSTMDT